MNNIFTVIKIKPQPTKPQHYARNQHFDQLWRSTVIGSLYLR